MAKEKLAEALFWKKERNGVRCELCSWKCFITKDKLGFCNVRKNVDNKLYSLNYGKVTSTGLMRMEDIPLFHFYPGAKTFFVHTVGSSFRHDFKEIGGREKEVGVAKMCSEIAKSRTGSAAFGGGDPVVEMEYVLDVMKANKKEGIANIFVTNGYLTNDVNKKVNKFIDAVALEIYASLDGQFYREHCAVEDVEPVLAFMKHVKKHRIHMEIANVVIPQTGEGNDSFRRLTEFITSEIDSYMPFHLVQFRPQGAMAQAPKAANGHLEKLYEEAKRGGMRNVFIEGVAGREDTLCYNCNDLLIKRVDRAVKKINMKGDRCPSCGLKNNVVNK